MMQKHPDRTILVRMFFGSLSNVGVHQVKHANMNKRHDIQEMLIFAIFLDAAQIPKIFFNIPTSIPFIFHFFPSPILLNSPYIF